MILRPVVLPIPLDDSLNGAVAVERQRSTARRALSICARRSGVAVTRWRQDDNRVPVPSGGYHWSISHKPLMVAAVISDEAVGIDIEHIQERGNRGLWDRLADDREWDAAGERCWRMFFRLWTAKEAALKANGRGISGLEECRVVEVADDRHVAVEYAGRRWSIEHFYHDDHIAALTTGEHEVRWLVETLEAAVDA